MDRDFSDILDHSLDEVQPPALVPQGPWLLRGIAMKATAKEFKDKETGEIVRYTQMAFGYEPFEPQAGVDPDEIAAGDYEGATVWVRRNIRNARDEAQVKEFVEKHGISTEGRTWRQIMSAFRGCLIHGNVTREVSTNKKTNETTPFNGVNDFRPVEEVPFETAEAA